MNKRLRFKLLVLDLDYTLTDASNRVHPADVKAVIEAQNHGVKVAFSTGRTRSDSVQKIAEIVKLPRYGGRVFCLNGGLLYDPKTEQIITKTTLNKHVVETISQKMMANNIVTLFVTSEKNVVYGSEKSWIHWIVRYWAGWKIKILSPGEIATKDVIAIFVFPLPWRKKMFKFFSDYALNNHLSYYQFRNWFAQITPTNKAAGLLNYLQTQPILKDEVLIIGDSNNDLEMFQKFRYTIAMGNATSMVWKHSFYQTKHYKKAGVAYALKRYLFRSEPEKN